MTEIRRKNLRPGMMVEVNLNNEIVRGIIKEVIPPHLSNNDLEVELTTGSKGPLVRIVTKNEIEQETFKFYNLFFHSRHLLTIWNKYTKKTLLLRTSNKRTAQVEYAAMLFSSEEIAKKFLEELDDKDHAIRRISRQIPITENFKNEMVTHYRLDESRRLNEQRLNQLEEQFARF